MSTKNRVIESCSQNSVSFLSVFIEKDFPVKAILVLFQSKTCATSLDELYKKKFSWSDFKTTAAYLVHETQDKLLGVAVGLGEQPFYKDLSDKSFEER